MKVKIAYRWQVWKTVKGVAEIEVPDNWPHSLRDFINNNAVQIIDTISIDKDIQPHRGDVDAGLESGFVELTPHDRNHVHGLSFPEWFESLKRTAADAGYTVKEAAQFDQEFWKPYWRRCLTPIDAITAQAFPQARTKAP